MTGPLGVGQLGVALHQDDGTPQLPMIARSIVDFDVPSGRRTPPRAGVQLAAAPDDALSDRVAADRPVV